MKRSMHAAAFLAALGAAGAARGAVLISEVLYNEVGSDTTGEWVEIMNTGPALVDLSGYKFGDEETRGGDTESGGMWQFPENTTLAPGQVVVVTVSGARFTSVYGKAPGFELTGVFADDEAVPNMRPYLGWVDPAEPNNMANGNDQAILLGPDDSVADAVSWGNPVAFDPGLAPTVLDGQSYRRTSLEDTDTAADWEMSPDTGAAATRSSPGEVTAVPEPGAMGVIGVMALVTLRRWRRA